MAEEWRIVRDFVDFCKCRVPCAFATASEADAFGFKWNWTGRSAKHMPFVWSSEDEF